MLSDLHILILKRMINFYGEACREFGENEGEWERVQRVESRKNLYKFIDSLKEVNND